MWRLGGSILLLLLTALPSDAFAMGSEWSVHARDLMLRVDERWAGGAYGGYYPIRISLTNKGRPRSLTFRLSSAGGGGSNLPTVERTIVIEQNARQHFTLPVPLVNTEVYGVFQVFEEGRSLKEFEHDVSVPAAHLGGADRPSLLVISPVLVDCDRFEDAVTSLAAAAASSSSSGPWGYGGWAGSTDHQVIGTELLPENWIDYSGLDIVAVPFTTFERLTPAVRTAIIKWVEAGGNLLVYEAGTGSDALAGLNKLLALDDRRALSSVWIGADPKLRKVITVVNSEGTSALSAVPATSVMPTVIAPASTAAEEKKEPDSDPTAPPFIWDDSSDAFRRRDVMFGHVFAFAGNPFPGSPSDWAWLLNSDNAVKWKWKWLERNGLSSRMEHEEFMKFLIPGVGGVPVLAFLGLITVFTIVIGPVNYWLLWRRKQLYLLVVTIPAIAILTSGSLFGYAVIADGFGVKSRLRSFTLLDQQNRTAVSINRIALYAGLAPSAGLSFPADTAVFPIWPDDRGLESGRIDWTNTQHYATGWLRSRTITQLETIAHRTERGRLEIKPAAEEKLEVANGLAWEIGTLIVRDDHGGYYFGKDLPAGASKTVLRATNGDLRRLSAELAELTPQFPTGVASGGSNPWDWGYGLRYAMRAGYGATTPAKFEHSLLEQSLGPIEHKSTSTADWLPKKSYVAVFPDNPGIDLGLEKTNPHSGVHVLLGRY